MSLGRWVCLAAGDRRASRDGSLTFTAGAGRPGSAGSPRVRGLKVIGRPVDVTSMPFNPS